MTELEEWMLETPYTAEEVAYIEAETDRRRKSNYITESEAHGEWTIAKSREIMKGTWLEQDLVPLTHHLGPWQFGYLGGPVYSFETIMLHEVAHGIQLKKKDYTSRVKNFKRFQQPKSSTQTILGQTYYEPFTMDVSLCEAEANGIQLVLLEELGYKIDHKAYFDRWAYVNRFLPDWYHGGQNHHEIVAKAIEVYYLVWNSQKSIMKERYKNFCTYVGKLWTKYPGTYHPGYRDQPKKMTT